MMRTTVLLVLLLSGCHTRAVRPESTWPKPQVPGYLLHLPGIAGDRGLDTRMIKALAQSGFDGTAEIYNWTQEDAGLRALTNQQRHRREAEAVAAKITAVRRASPNREIILTGHSGGTGVIVWALEKLPEDVHVDRVVLIASALSPDYNLSKALAHVDGAMVSFHSPLDVAVLDVGTTLFGTIDGKKTAAAGCVGFVVPSGADPKQYQKLRQYAYTAEWMQWGNSGTHIGAMARPFARVVLAPIVMGVTLHPPLARGGIAGATTLPAE